MTGACTNRLVLNGEACVAEVMVTHPKTLGPDSTADQARASFSDHVHMALIVASDGRLVTTIEPADIPCETPGSTPARGFGTLVGRTIHPRSALNSVTAALRGSGRRRLAVVDDQNRLLGLLCLKRSGDGYCSDEGVRARAEERSA
jgi:CBS domain-containing protein